MTQSPHPLRQLDMLDDSLNTPTGYTGTARWMIPYADFLTLLLGFFIILFAYIQSENNSLAEMAAQAEYELAQAHSRLEAMEQQQPKQPQPEEATAILMQAIALDPAQQLPAGSLESSLAQQLSLDGHQVTIREDARGLVLSFQERIFFEPGKASLTPKALKTLDKLAGVLLKTNHPIRVEGHTDNTPIKTALFPSNWELSTARATTIVRHLIEKHRFPPQRLSAAGYGEHAPLAKNSTIEGKQKNRRVDIVLLNPLSGSVAQKDPPQPAGHSPTKE